MTAGKPATRITADLVIVGTSYVTPRRGEDPFYALIAYPHGDTDAQPAAFITRDETLWDIALNLENLGAAVVVTWHQAKRPNGQLVQVATDIARQPRTRTVGL